MTALQAYILPPNLHHIILCTQKVLEVINLKQLSHSIFRGKTLQLTIKPLLRIFFFLNHCMPESVELQGHNYLSLTPTRGNHS